VLRYVFNGALGVLAFFVLSGFLITYLLAREEQERGHFSLRDFYIRRCLRILPVYFWPLGLALTAEDALVLGWADAAVGAIVSRMVLR
jgi:peptidoglycan/LPS O-acetylase OafA/YrhL